MTCKDCIHYDDCLNDERTRYYSATISCNVVEKHCDFFKDKTDFVKVKHAKWIYEVKYYSCSNCAGKRFNLLLGTDAEFCPYCGAKMKAK